MKAGIFRAEVSAKPRFKLLSQFRLEIGVAALIEGIHDVPDVVQQGFVVFFVLRVLVVFEFAHHALLEGEVRGDPCVDFTEKIGDSLPRGATTKPVMELVDEVNQLAVLVIDRLDPDFERLAPGYQRHGGALTTVPSVPPVIG